MSASKLHISNKQSFYRDYGSLWINTLIPGIAFSVLGIFLVKYQIKIAFESDGMKLCYIFIIMSACLIVVSLFSFLSKKILVASLDNLGIDLYIGILGQDESIRLAWDDIQSVSIANRDIKTKTTSTSLFITVTNKVTHKVLAIKMATPLSQKRQEELQSFNKRLVTRGLIFDDESSEFWIKDSIKGGLSKLMNSINKHIA